MFLKIQSYINLPIFPPQQRCINTYSFRISGAWFGMDDTNNKFQKKLQIWKSTFKNKSHIYSRAAF